MIVPWIDGLPYDRQPPHVKLARRRRRRIRDQFPYKRLWIGSMFADKNGPRTWGRPQRPTVRV